MEFKKSDIIESSSGSGGGMELEEFLNNLSQNFEQVEDILDKADKAGLSVSPKESKELDRQQGGQKVDQMLANNRGEQPESSSNSESSHQPNTQSSGSALQLIYQMLEQFEDDVPAETVEQELKGRIANIFSELPEGTTVADLKEWVNSPMGQKFIQNKAEEMI